MPAAKKPAAKKPARVSTHVPRPKPKRSAAQQAAIARAFERVRRLCLAHPGVYEQEAWSEATFRLEKGKMFLMFADNHHDDGRVAIWCMSTPDAREALLELDPDRYFVPPYVGPSGWIGARLDPPDSATVDGQVPWDVIAELVADAVKLGAVKKAPRR